MGLLSIQMLGRLYVRHNDNELTNLGTRKAQELLCYLLLHRQRPHARETLANVFWSNTPTAQSRANLRKTLWQLQIMLGEPLADELIQIEAEWVQIKENSWFCLDVALLEQALAAVHNCCGEQMSESDAQLVSQAVMHYRGDLLEGWYHDWCLFERERLQSIYLALLDRLMGYCEQHQEYERGLAYGTELLRYDRTREQTYCRMMRLQARAGNRASALREYERCVDVLADELGIAPSVATTELYMCIRDNLALDDEPKHSADTIATGSLQQVLTNLRMLQLSVAQISQTLDSEIDKIEGLARKHLQ
jgi:DNA-binding SARP family transcriptional activator